MRLLIVEEDKKLVGFINKGRRVATRSIKDMRKLIQARRGMDYVFET